MKTKLSVNVNKIATLRNSRGGNVPNVVQMAKDALDFGAHGITVHPRPDARHIRHNDVFELKEMLTAWNLNSRQSAEFNIEGYPDENYLALVKNVKPQQATLVPDPPHVLTSNAGWKLFDNEVLLKKVVNDLKANNIRVSLFIDVFQWSDSELKALSRIRPERVELYTETFARDPKTVSRYKEVADMVLKEGIELNAGHDLTSENLPVLLRAIPEIKEVSIGHQLVADSLYWGWQKTIATYLNSL